MMLEICIRCHNSVFVYPYYPCQNVLRKFRSFFVCSFYFAENNYLKCNLFLLWFLTQRFYVFHMKHEFLCAFLLLFIQCDVLCFVTVMNVSQNHVTYKFYSFQLLFILLGCIEIGFEFLCFKDDLIQVLRFMSGSWDFRNHFHSLQLMSLSFQCIQFTSPQTTSNTL